MSESKCCGCSCSKAEAEPSSSSADAESTSASVFREHLDLEDRLREMTDAQLGDILADSQRDQNIRYRALFHLKERGGPSAIDQLARGLNDESALLKHEICYVMGQMSSTHALPILKRVIENATENCMVRHEAAEAIGAIDDYSMCDFLRGYLKDPMPEVSETAEIAIARLEDSKKKKEEGKPFHPPATYSEVFGSVDPSPAAEESDVEFLGTLLLNKDAPLYDRYKAMFGLRNIGSSKCVQYLCEAFEDASALFRHEIAFVLGQLQSPESVTALAKVLENLEEHPMVRHEAAEAMGSIASEGVDKLLAKYCNDPAKPVAESCDLAVKMFEYWSNFGKSTFSDDAEENVE